MVNGAVLSWLHVGDLHLTEAGLENHRNFQTIIGLVRELPDHSVDFVLLPGDNADDGTDAQFALVHDALAGLDMPVHILTGDHDFQPRNLDTFYRTLGAQKLPYAVTVGQHRCLFLDVVSRGTGGPDFRLDAAQRDWLRDEIADAAARGQDVAVFMHTYPADLREGRDEVRALLAQDHVRCVDMGHTHYNELANDGGTIFMATRSTGQIEEGPAGFSVAALDGGCVSWRFKTLEQPWPFVLITQPADHRLATAASQATQVVRARVIGDASIARVEVRGSGGDWTPMAQDPADRMMWTAPRPPGARFMSGDPAIPVDGVIEVRAVDAHGRQDTDRVTPSQDGTAMPRRAADGSDRDRVSSWPEHHLFDTQLGPNRNGRKW